MRLHWLAAVCGSFLLPAALADVEFHAVRTNNQKSQVKLELDKPHKYFHESLFHKHYDGRFGERELAGDELRSRLSYLLQAYLRTMDNIGMETWLMHGSLLSWWWNHKIMPWDTEVKAMISEKSLRHMVAFYNMTVHRHHLPGLWSPREYLLEISPHSLDGKVDADNAIDARFIDTDVGLYIDIATLRRSKSTGSAVVEPAMYTKDGHKYNYADVFPLWETTFESMPARIPRAYESLLKEEYGAEVLSHVSFDGHQYSMKEDEWIPNRQSRVVATAV